MFSPHILWSDSLAYSISVGSNGAYASGQIVSVGGVLKFTENVIC